MIQTNFLSDICVSPANIHKMSSGAQGKKMANIKKDFAMLLKVKEDVYHFSINQKEEFLALVNSKEKSS